MALRARRELVQARAVAPLERGLGGEHVGVGALGGGTGRGGEGGQDEGGAPRRGENGHHGFRLSRFAGPGTTGPPLWDRRKRAGFDAGVPRC